MNSTQANNVYLIFLLFTYRMFNNESLITARIGIHNSSAFSEDRNEQAFKIIKVILNTKPHLKMVPFDNDIALLKFHQPVAYNSSVKPICLPSNKEIDRTVCAITGWGRYRGINHYKHVCK